MIDRTPIDQVIETFEAARAADGTLTLGDDVPGYFCSRYEGNPIPHTPIPIFSYPIPISPSPCLIASYLCLGAK